LHILPLQVARQASPDPTEVFVKKTLLAAALAAVAAVAAPVVVGFAQVTPQQAAPAAAPAGPGRGMPEMRGGPMMRRMFAHRMMWRERDRSEWCIDRLARRAARLAYIETKLDLTAAQRPLWDKVASAAQAEEQKERQLCDSLKQAAAPTVIERLDRMQQFLTARLDGLQAAKPALEALYQALTPAQRAILDRPFHRS
jgi:hypothetical protein